MDSDNFSELDIKNLIIDFNLDESINDLKKYYATPTTWEILKQSRKETIKILMPIQMPDL